MTSQRLSRSPVTTYMDESLGIVIVGGGGHARVVAEAIWPSKSIGHVSPSPVDDLLLGPWLGDDDIAADLAADGHMFAFGIGFVDRAGAERRSQILDSWRSGAFLSVVHPTAIVSPSAVLAPGSFVAAGAIVGVASTVGDGAIINSGAIIDHEGLIGRNVHIGPGAVLSGGVSVGADTLIGVGATVRQGIRIGASVVVGAGAVVVADVADGATVLGVPARAVRS